MNQNLCFNIFIFLIILIVLKYISPNPDSVLFVLKKYLNFLIFKINRFIKQIFNYNEDFGIVTFKGLSEFQDKAPSFISYHQNMFIQKMIEKNPTLDVKLLKKLYAFMEKMVTTDTDDYFLTVSDSEQKNFSEAELDKIKTIIFNKLNSGSFKFTEINIEGPVSYYTNLSGKEVNPFSFTVTCDNNIGQLKVFLSIDIRNDVVKNASYIVFKKIRINVNSNESDINAKKVNFDITSDVTNKVIFDNSLIESQKIPEKCNNYSQPSYYDNPVNLNLKFDSNYNINVDNIEIPNYDEILNSYNENYNELLNNKDKNIINMSMPMIDFSKQFKTNNYNASIEPSNNDETMNNMLDNILEFKIPHESTNNISTVSLNNSSSASPFMIMPPPNNLASK